VQAALSNGPAASNATFSTPTPGTLHGAKQVVGNVNGTYCALLASGQVDCWGDGIEGQLGDGIFYSTSPYGSARPATVLGSMGGNPLAGVRSLISDDDASFCALMISSEVECWGAGTVGEIGDGFFGPSNLPAGVEGVGGSGLLSGATRLASDGTGYCALLASGGVVCWGWGAQGQLGDGVFYPSSGNAPGSATPVQVVSVGGTAPLTQVKSLTSDGFGSYCVLLTSNAVDCWGNGSHGELGNGVFYNSGNDGSAMPVQVLGVGGSGFLVGARGLTSRGDGSFCAVLTSGEVDCWGSGASGQLGDGSFHTTAPYGSAAPVQVLGVGGSGVLTGVSSLTSGGENYCAVLASGGVDCWGWGTLGQLGDGVFYNSGNDGSATPVEVVGVGGTGLLSAVRGLISDDGDGYCALLTSRSVDCWGSDNYGDLGNPTLDTGQNGSSMPVHVVGIGGRGLLSGVTTLASVGLLGYEDGFCALSTVGGLDCWGYGGSGALGDGTFYDTGIEGSAAPVEVLKVGTSITAWPGDRTGPAVYVLSATLTYYAANVLVEGATVVFKVDGVKVCSGITDMDGFASCTASNLTTTASRYTATYVGNGSTSGASIPAKL
jgi:alpha-tubulin suppressor-like RCC1 family protein